MGLRLSVINFILAHCHRLQNALAAIRQVVYVEKAVTMEELIAALSCNYEGYETLRQKMLSAPKFGNDIDQVDLIAADLSKRFCQYVKDTPYAGRLRGLARNLFHRLYG